MGVDKISLRVDGQPVVLNANGQATITRAAAGTVQVIATATDLSGNTAQQTEDLLVVDPSVVGDPNVDITSPTLDDLVTARIDVIGTADDPDLDYYTLEVAPLGGSFVEVARGTTSVVDGVLGQFDPSVLENDQYRLRLTAVDTGGNDAVFETIINVTGSLKIGNFSLSFTDLSIPVAGIPITVTRTYDSFTSTRQDDFGFGWRMEIADTDLRTSVPKTGLEDVFIYNPFFYGTRVYVSRPGEPREGFTFQPRLAPGVAGRYLGIWRPEFVPDEGVDSTLTVDSVDLFPTDSGEFIAAGLAYNPANPVIDGSFTLTTKDGIRYEIDGNTGDTRTISDLNGNTLTFSDSGIVHSSGTAIQFERDPQGRITAVVDPTGQRVEYRYDTAGDLVAAIDREGNSTTFVYDEPSRSHFLTAVVDPLGRTGVRSEYDDQGRLVKMIDANGKQVELLHDPDNFTETVKDQLGNPTIYEYDSLGNVVTEIDPEGGVTTRTYTDPNNPTLETTVTVVLEDGTQLTTQFAYDSRGNVVAETDPLGNVTRNTYDGFGNVLTTTDPLGNTTTNRHDAKGNLLSITSPDGQITSFTYDASGNPLQLAIGSNVTKFQYDSAGNVTRQEDAAGTVRTFTYDGAGNQLTESVQFTTPSGPSTVLTENEYDADGRLIRTTTKQDGVVLSTSQTLYDAVGNRVEEIDALGRSTKFVYDDRGLMTETIYPDDTPSDDTDNPRTQTEYDAAGQVTAEIDELGRVTRFEYDKTGRQTRTIFPDDTPGDDSDNPFTETLYDLAGRVTDQVDERGNRTEFIYDAAGNQLATILPDATPSDLTDNPRITSVYDAAGRQLSTTDPLGNVTTTLYCDCGRPRGTVFADGTSTTMDFDDQGRLIARTDQNGIVTQYEHDDLGRLTAVVQTVDGADLRTQYEYDELGNLVVQRDANSHETHFEYDGLGRRIATVLPLGQRSETTYDAVGHVDSMTDFNGDAIIFEYDTLDRLIKKDFPTGTDTSFTYTLNGQRETVTDDRGVTTYEYDARDRLVLRTDPDGSQISYTYDTAGNRTSVTTIVLGNSARTTTYTFDEQNRQKTVTDPEGGLTTYFYDAASRLTRTELPNGTFETRQYDNLHRLKVLESSNSSGAFDRYEYHLDAAGNRLAVTELDGRHVEYAYDEIYRLLGESIFDPNVDPAVDPPSRAIEYTYDSVGNRLARDDSAEGATTYTYDDNDRLLTETLSR